MAAFNGPSQYRDLGRGSRSRSGHREPLRAWVRGRGAQYLACVPLQLMEPILEEFLREASNVKWSPPVIEFVSNLTGGKAGAAARRPEYWRDHIREPVRFADCMTTLAGFGCDTFVEIGPHPTLVTLGRSCLADRKALWVASLKRGQDDYATCSMPLARLYAAGVELDWRAVANDVPGEAMPLPNYPFQRERFWCATTPSDAPAAGPVNEILGRELVHSPAPIAFRTRIELGAGQGEKHSDATAQPGCDPLVDVDRRRSSGRARRLAAHPQGYRDHAAPK